MSTKTVLDPFANGRTRRISLAARRPGSGDLVADERQLHADLASQDPAVRQRAIRHLNAVAEQALGVLLSSTSQFPDQQTQGVTTVVSFGEGDRWSADVRWRALFQMRDLTADTHPFFAIDDVYDSVAFDEYEMGERIRFGSVRADREIFETPIVAGGLQWFQFWEGWQSQWNTSDGIASMNAKWLRRMAKAAYAVVTAAGLTVVPYDAAGASQVEKDVNTINAALTTLGNQVFQSETGFAGVESEEDIEGLSVYLLYNSGTAGYRQRVNRALGARLELPNDSNSAAEVDVPVMPLPTRYVPANGWWLVLAGRKNVHVVKKALQIYDHMDARIAGISDGRIAQGAYKSVRGDTRQAVQVSTS